MAPSVIVRGRFSIIGPIVTLFAWDDMAVTASGCTRAADCAHGDAVAAKGAVRSPIIALFRVFDDAVAASRRVGVAAWVNPGAVRAAIRAWLAD